MAVDKIKCIGIGALLLMELLYWSTIGYWPTVSFALHREEGIMKDAVGFYVQEQVSIMPLIKQC